MKAVYHFIIFILTLGSLSALDVSVTTQVFYNSESPYLELYSRIIGKTAELRYTPQDSSLLNSKVELVIIIEKNGITQIAEKYNILGPQVKTPVDFWDLKRYGLENGAYDLKLQYVDLNNVLDTLRYEEVLEVNFHDNQLSNSDILLMSDIETTDANYKFEKAGFFYEPLCYDLVGSELDQLYMYFELYNAKGIFEEDYYFKFYPVNLDIDSEREFVPGYKKMKVSGINQAIIDYDVSDLPSGNYSMVVEVNKPDKTIMHVFEKSFSVYHPLIDYQNHYAGDQKFETSFVQFLDAEELDYGLKAIFPRTGQNLTETLNLVISSKELDVKRYYLYRYWSAFSIDDPKSIYDKYMDVAKAIDLRYANNVGHGFETDRGYYFLKYGKPDNIISVEDEPSAPPYEIWLYNYLVETQQTNVKFLFYNPSLVTNDFKLLHSTCRGELQNPRWEVDLYSDDTQGQNNNYLDARTTQDNFNRNARRYFTDF